MCLDTNYESIRLQLWSWTGRLNTRMAPVVWVKLVPCAWCARLVRISRMNLLHNSKQTSTTSEGSDYFLQPHRLPDREKKSAEAKQVTDTELAAYRRFCVPHETRSTRHTRTHSAWLGAVRPRCWCTGRGTRSIHKSTTKSGRPGI